MGVGPVLFLSLRSQRHREQFAVKHQGMPFPAEAVSPGVAYFVHDFRAVRPAVVHVHSGGSRALLAMGASGAGNFEEFHDPLLF
jgi:hypothetical protein